MGIFKKAKKRAKKAFSGAKNKAIEAITTKKGLIKTGLMAGTGGVGGAIGIGVGQNAVFTQAQSSGIEGLIDSTGGEGSADSPLLTAQREEDARNLAASEERKKRRKGRLARTTIANNGTVNLGREKLLGA